MKKIVFSVIIALMLVLSSTQTVQTKTSSSITWQAPAYGWGSGWCNNCYLYENIDIPNAGTGWVGYLAGWTAHGYNGAPATRIELWINGRTDKNAFVYWGLYRPDLFPYTNRYDNGWAIYPSYPFPVGTHSVSIVFWYGMVSTTQTGTIVIN